MTQVNVKKSMKAIFLTFWILILFPYASLAGRSVSVFVSIAPQKYFVEKIGKDRVSVEVMVKAGANPASYEPKPRQMAALTKAEIYFAIGVPFEFFWMRKIAAANQNMTIVNTDKGIHKLLMKNHIHEQKAKEEDHNLEEHEIPDPHIWLSPPLVRIQANNIFNALLKVAPENRSFYQENFQQFVQEIETLDKELQTVFSFKKGIKFMVFHPSWGYFAENYGLEQIPIEIEGKEPKPAQLTELIKHAKKQGIKVIFVQPQFSTKSAEIIAKAIGGRVAAADPLHENWAKNIRFQAAQFKEILR